MFQEYIDTVKMLTKRVDALDEQLEISATESVFCPVIESLMALRGISLLTATTIMAEIGDLKSFASAPELMAYLGLVPSEPSSGQSKSRGGITRTGNSRVRRVLVEQRDRAGALGPSRPRRGARRVAMLSKKPSSSSRKGSSLATGSGARQTLCSTPRC